MKIILVCVLLLILAVGIMTLIGLWLPREHVATRAATFRQPPDVLFAVIRDFSTAPTWRSGLQTVALLPPEQGRVRYREVGRNGPVTYQVDAERRNEHLTVTITDNQLPYGGGWSFALSAVGSGTRLRITERGFVKPPLFRFLARFAFGSTATMETYLRDLGKKFGDSVVVEN